MQPATRILITTAPISSAKLAQKVKTIKDYSIRENPLDEASFEDQNERRGCRLLWILLAIAGGIVLGATAFADTTIGTNTQTKVVNQTVAIYDIQEIDIEGRCYDSFGDSLGPAKNVRSGLRWDDEQMKLRGRIGHIVVRNPVDELEVDSVECPENATSMELRINTVEYEYTVYQAGTVLANGTATASVFEYIEARRRTPYDRWDRRGYNDIDEIYHAMEDEQPW